MLVHLNPNCKNAYLCNSHGETGEVTYKDKKLGINLGCGDHHFDSNSDIEWINMDLDNRDGKVEVAGDVSKKLPFPNEMFDIMVASHIAEHIEMSIVSEVIKDWMRCLKKDGQLIITVPDSRALAERYVTKDIDHFIFAINMTGPYHGRDTDHHSWCYDLEELTDRVKDYDWEFLTSENLPKELKNGMIALDWWILSIIVKHKQ
jgi:predicted SAM-dependent methyltransferase